VKYFGSRFFIGSKRLLPVATFPSADRQQSVPISPSAAAGGERTLLHLNDRKWA